MNEGVSALLAFFAGIASFLSPCVFPLLPSYLSLIGAGSAAGGEGETDGAADAEARARRKTFFRTLCFVGGFSTLFVALGFAVSSFGLFIGRFSSIINVVAGIIIIFFGAQMVFNFSRFLQYEKRLFHAKAASSNLSAFLIGIAFAAGWSPCIGPVLTSILFLAAQSNSAVRGILYLSVYSLGLGIPFLLVGNVFSFGALQGVFRRYGRPIRLSCGILLMLTGALILFGRFQRLNSFMVNGGRRLAAWSVAAPGGARAIGALVLGGIAGLLGWWAVRSWQKRRSAGEKQYRFPVSPTAVVLGGAAVVVLVLTVLGTVSPLYAIGQWLQFQGL